MILILFFALPFLAYCLISFLCRDGPKVYFREVPKPRPRRTVADFIRSAYRKLGQRQLRKNDRRLFAAGDRRAFA